MSISRIHVTRLMLTLAALALSAACSDSNTRAAAGSGGNRDTLVKVVTPRHSAGGTLVEDVSIGERDGPAEYLFTYVAAAVAARDGTVWLLDREGMMPTSGGSVRQYDSSGRYIRSLARQGQGPGELHQPTSIAQMKDGRLAVWSYTSRRINTYSEQGQFLDVWRLENSTGNSRNDAFLAGHDGNLYLRLSDPGFRPGRWPVRAPSYVQVMGSDGAIGDTISTTELPDVSIEHVVYYRKDPSGGVTMRSRPFLYSPKTIIEWNPLGFWVTGFGNLNAFELRVPPRGAPAWRAGDPVVSIRWHATPVRVSDEERSYHQKSYDEYISAWPAEYQVGPVGARVPDVKPAWSGVFTGQDGRMWVQVSRASEPYELTPWGDPPVYDVYEPDGTLLGRVRVNDVRIIATRGDRVWAVHRDADGVQSVKGLRIDWK